ncbi:hypothetical protein PLICRDRAFT_180821 [Plicaturopsis crispa FD-325 SS-3]|uniref:Myb-like domain-containing protein n=1 Tax=Plicaturopsis crispa FD-325 SS-3 TaxID=944288 RepID=A0A0C9SPU4_PLICR|nr:hypothetical protein PLICRDRAFT_180821 [Plicaturopsis crispa FD-325 SS-3]
MDRGGVNPNDPRTADHALAADPRVEAQYGFPPMQFQGQGYAHPFVGSMYPTPPWVQIPPAMYNSFGLSFPTFSSPPFAPDEEDAIIAALARGVVTSTDACSALETLHGMNGRNQQEWKDHYLRNKLRIDKLVDDSKDKYATADFPPSNDNPGGSESRSTSSIGSAYKRHIVDHASDSEPDRRGLPRRNVEKKAHPVSSISTRRGKQKASYTSGSPSPQPPSPSHPATPGRHLTGLIERSPIHPSLTVPAGPGHAFTDEDKRFFRRTLVYEIRKNPEVSRVEIIRKLHAKAPHRSENSWDHHWARSPGVKGLVDRLRNNQVETPEGDEDGSSSEYAVCADPGDQNERTSTVPRKAKTQRWTRDEIEVLAKHVATLPERNFSRIDWIRCQKVIPHRTVGAISSFYTKNRTKIEDTITALGLPGAVAEPSAGPSSIELEPSSGSESDVEWPASVHIYGYDSDINE